MKKHTNVLICKQKQQNKIQINQIFYFTISSLIKMSDKLFYLVLVNETLGPVSSPPSDQPGPQSLNVKAGITDL